MVVTHQDSAVSTLVRTITENVPDVQVVECGSLEYALTIHRTLEDAVSDIGVGVTSAIVLAGLETTKDVFCDTYVSRLTYSWTGMFTIVS
ncbi:MAG: hypothetical protein DRO93_12765 [Candidatus Thorarchaeota archaeon]|nr:MAG: hypothetical protein DRO93_12765 [Candidatus Thorarchaeota archaeon]